CNSLAVTFSRCKDSARSWLRASSSWRSSAIVCDCSGTDVFTTGTRRFAFLFFESFFGVVAIKHRVGRPSQPKLKTWPDRFTLYNSSPVFYAKAVGGVKERLRCGAKPKNGSCRKYETRALNFCRARLDVRTGTKPPPPGSRNLV